MTLARSSFEGKLLVRQAAQKVAEAFQLNNNLLSLSDRANADSKPNLETFADDAQSFAWVYSWTTRQRSHFLYEGTENI